MSSTRQLHFTKKKWFFFFFFTWFFLWHLKNLLWTLPHSFFPSRKAPAWVGGRKNINFTKAWREVSGHVRNHTVTRNTWLPGRSRNQPDWPFKQQEIFTHSGSLSGCVSKWSPSSLERGVEITSFLLTTPSQQSETKNTFKKVCRKFLSL